MRKSVCKSKGVHLHKIVFKEDDLYHPRLVFRVNPRARTDEKYCVFLGYEVRRFVFENNKKQRLGFERRKSIDTITAIGIMEALRRKEYATVPLFSKREYNKQLRLKLMEVV